MSIYPDKKDGKLTGRFRVELQQGKRRYRKRWDTHKEAIADEKAVLAAWERGEDVYGSDRALGSPEVFSFSTVVPLARGKLWHGIASESDCWAHIDAIAAILGRNTRLDNVDTASVDKVITALEAKGLKDGTINRYLSHLSKFLKWSLARKYRTVPLDERELTIEWKKESDGRIRWITPEEEAELKRLMPPRGWKLVKVAIETGCRRDELITAQPEQINGNRLHLWETKTDSPRTVFMSPETTALLTDLVVKGEMPSRRSLRRWWDNARAKMGLANDPAFVFHVTRHTCATRLVDAGINPFVIKEWMGHKRIETTLRYAHVKSQNLEDALAAVGDYMTRKSQDPSNSATFSSSPPYPTGGENRHLAYAA